MAYGDGLLGSQLFDHAVARLARIGGQRLLRRDKPKQLFRLFVDGNARHAFAWRSFRPSCGGRRSTTTPSAEFTTDYFGRDRLVLAFHGDFVDLYFLFAGVCTLNQRRTSLRGAEPGDQTHG